MGDGDRIIAGDGRGAGYEGRNAGDEQDNGRRHAGNEGRDAADEQETEQHGASLVSVEIRAIPSYSRNVVAPCIRCSHPPDRLPQ